jgi:hypothetical protein
MHLITTQRQYPPQILPHPSHVEGRSNLKLCVALRWAMKISTRPCVRLCCLGLPSVGLASGATLAAVSDAKASSISYVIDPGTSADLISSANPNGVVETITGSFTFDAATDTESLVSIIATGAGPFAGTYIGNSIDISELQSDDSNNAVCGTTTGGDSLCLVFQNPLNGSGDNPLSFVGYGPGGPNSTPTALDNIPIGGASPAAATPLPTTLPLFGSGVGAMGLLGWRRKRKATGAAENNAATETKPRTTFCRFRECQSRGGRKMKVFRSAPAFVLAALATLWLPTSSAHAASFTTGEFVSWSQVAWGDTPAPGNVSYLLEQQFNTLYAPSDLLQVGVSGVSGYHYMEFDSGDAVIAYLPSGGAPAALTADLDDPVSNQAGGSLGGEVTTLKLNIDFSAAGLLAHPAGITFGDLILTSLTGSLAPLNGLTISDLLTQENLALAGAPSDFTSVEDAFVLANDVDMAFNGGDPPSTFALQNLEVPEAPTTPLPATLPLFASGLGFVGYLAKRKRGAKSFLLDSRTNAELFAQPVRDTSLTSRSVFELRRCKSTRP